MKALLIFGPFRHFMDIPEVKQDLYIPHPMGILDVDTGAYGRVSTEINHKLRFRYRITEKLYGDFVSVYEFQGIE